MIKNIGIVFAFSILSVGLIFCKKDSPAAENPPLVDPLAFTQGEKDLILNNSRDSAMRILNYFIYEDSLILRKQSIDINFNDTATLFYLTDRMHKTCLGAGGVGIAAPQVGINRNIIWVQRWDKGNINSHPWEVYFNPVITKYSDTVKQRNDGCLSIPGVSGTSWRAIWVDVEYFLPDGSKKSERINHQYTAHIFQHEIDHLNGIVWLDRM